MPSDNTQTAQSQSSVSSEEMENKYQEETKQVKESKPKPVGSYADESKNLASKIKKLESFAAARGQNFQERIGTPVDFVTSKFDQFKQELDKTIKAGLKEAGEEKVADGVVPPSKQYEDFLQQVSTQLTDLHKQLQTTKTVGIDAAHQVIAQEFTKLADIQNDTANKDAHSKLQEAIKKQIEKQEFEKLCASQAQWLAAKFDDRGLSNSIKTLFLADEVKSKGFSTEYKNATAADKDMLRSLAGVSESNVGASKASYQTFQPGMMYDSADGKTRLYLQQDEKNKDMVTVRAVREEAGLLTQLWKGKTESTLYKEAKMTEMNFLAQQGYTDLIIGDMTVSSSPSYKTNAWLDAALDLSYDVFARKSLPPANSADPADKKILEDLKNKYVVTTESLVAEKDKLGAEIKDDKGIVKYKTVKEYALHYVDDKGVPHKIDAKSKEVEAALPKTLLGKLDTFKIETLQDRKDKTGKTIVGPDGRPKQELAVSAERIHLGKKMDHFEHLIQSHSLKDPAKGLTVDNINTDLAWIAKDAKGQFAGIKNHAILTANPQCQAIITKLRDMGKISEKEFKKFMEKLDKINRLAGMNKQLQEKDDLAADPDKPADPDKSAVTQKQQAGIIAGGENKDQPIPAEQASGIISGAVKDKEGLEEKIEIANTSSSPEPTPSPSPDPSIVTTDEGSSSESETDLQSPLSGNESDKDNNDDVTPSSFKPGGR